ncbi:MAG: hypothetical protein ABSA42_12985 [Terracidiphilus sp.]|jgi:hypothetical protein
MFFTALMRRKFISSLFAVLFACISPASAQTSNTAPLAPLPNANEILQRALANERKLASQRERYECRVTTTAIETDSRGNTKKNNNEVKDQFFVNGIAIERTLQKNGKDLTPEETKKEDERVMKETLKYSNQATAQKEENKQNQELGDFMEAMMLANGRRELINGRSVLFYDILPNPRFEARNIDQRLAQVMQGKISIDEPTGEPVDINVKSVADWKIGWGLLANVHKGLWLHIHNHPEPDGVWLTDFAEGSGDMREALFLHPYIHFKEVTDNCRLYTATATQVGPPQVVKPH